MTPDELLRESRAAYERGRLQRAVWRMLPLLGLLIAMGVVAQPDGVRLGLGSLLGVAAVLAVWRGRAWERGAMVGLMWGLLPFACAQWAAHQGGCPHHGCSEWCMSACLAGGFGAGLLAARRLGRDHHATFTASGFILVTGALGCACAGGSGILGVAAGVIGAQLVALIPRPV